MTERIVGRNVTLLIGDQTYNRPDAVLVVDGSKCYIDFETRSTADLDTGNKQLMAYAAGLDYGLTEARTLAYLATLHGDDVIMTPIDMGTELHRRLEQIAFQAPQRDREIMIKKAVDQMRPMCLEGERSGKRRKRRDWDQRDRKFRGR